MQPLIALLLWSTVALGADLQVECVRGCLPEGDRSPNLLYRESTHDAVWLRWSSPDDPSERGRWTVRLYAGNPAVQATLPDLGQFVFQDFGPRWRAQQAFSGSELGQGTFVTVVVRERGSRREILDWHAFRLLTVEEHEREVAGPEPATEGELDVVPAVLRADTARGPLPPGGGGDGAAWRSLVDGQPFADLDLDGTATGVPGISVTVGQPWSSGAGQLDQEAIASHLGEVPGHRVRFENLEWIEQDPRHIPRGRDGVHVDLVRYYAVVTLMTVPTVRRFEAGELVGRASGERPFFSHETSARLRDPEDPRLWSSYDERTHTEDVVLLRLLQDHVRRDRSVPGLPEVQVEDGDGGNTTFHVGFVASLDQWSDPEQTPGVVAVDVVAHRHGVGVVEGAGSPGEAGGLLAGWLAGGDPDPVDLDDPPDGWRATSAVAQPVTLKGSLPLMRRDPDLAQRSPLGDDLAWERALEPAAGTPPEGQPRDREVERFADAARFALSARLRAGSLVEMKGFVKKPVDLIPINAYAQYVLRFTVALPTAEQLILSEDPNIPARLDLTTEANLEKAKAFTLFGIDGRLVLALLGLALVVLLLLLVPGLRTFLSGRLQSLAPKPRE